MQRLQELDDCRLLLDRAGEKRVARGTGFAAVDKDRVGDRRQVAAVAIGCRVADVPQLARDEVLGAGPAVLTAKCPAYYCQINDFGSPGRIKLPLA